MKTLRFHAYGEPADVLRFEEADVPNPGANHIRVRVKACALNPADWALCRGLFPGDLPRGIGLDVSGIVDAVGEGVTNARTGDLVLGVPDFVGYPSAGAADYAILSVWTPVPAGLDLVAACALPMAIETPYRSLDILGVTSKHTLLVHGAGTMMGYSAVQMALMRGAKVVATAGDTFAAKLRGMGAAVTSYGDGMAERVLRLTDGAPDFVLDASPASGVLPELVKIAGGDPQRVLTITDHARAETMNVRNSFGDGTLRYDVLGEFAKLAAQGRFEVPIAATFPLQDWREAARLSQSGRAHGKLVLVPGGAR